MVNIQLKFIEVITTQTISSIPHDTLGRSMDESLVGPEGEFWREGHS